MSIGYFLDREHQPSEADMEAALGSSWQWWKTLTDFIAENYQIAPELNFGGKNYGWNLWYRKSGKSLTSLYPQRGSFIVQIVLGKDQTQTALTMEFCREVGRLVRETPQLHDGKWLFIPVKTAAELRDVEKLLLLKKHPLKRKDEK